MRLMRAIHRLLTLPRLGLALLVLLSGASPLRAAHAQAAPCAQPSDSGCPLAAGDVAWDILNNLDDVHTWRLTLPSRGDLRVVLGNLQADYDLHVYRSEGSLIGESTNEGTADDVVQLDGAAPGTYIVYVNSARGDITPAAYSLLATFAPSAAEGEPVTTAPTLDNVSFEQGQRLPTAWHFGDPWGALDPATRYEWANYTGHTGQRSVSIAHPAGRSLWKFERETGSVQQRYIVVPPAAVEFAAGVWCKSNRPADLGTGTNAPYLDFLTVQRENVINGWFRQPLRCDTEWTQNNVRHPLTNQVDTMTVWLGFDGPSSATVWFDDVSLSFD